MAPAFVKSSAATSSARGGRLRADGDSTSARPSLQACKSLHLSLKHICALVLWLDACNKALPRVSF